MDWKEFLKKWGGRLLFAAIFFSLGYLLGGC